MTGRDDKHFRSLLIRATEHLPRPANRGPKGEWIGVVMPNPASIGEVEKLMDDISNALAASSAPSSIEPKTANPERRSSLEHSEVKPDENDERRSGEVDREGSGSAGSARSDAMVAGCIERGSREAGRESDGEGRVTGEGPSAPVSATRENADEEGRCPTCRNPIGGKTYLEEMLLIWSVIEETQSLRRGIGVSYPEGQDPVARLSDKYGLPSKAFIVRTLEVMRRADDGAQKP